VNAVPSLAVAVGAGLLSFLSPCVLPLIPGYLSFIGGTGMEELRSGERRVGVFYRTLFFVAGFTAVFVGLGLAFSGGGMLVSASYGRAATIAAGLIIAALGLNTIFGFARFLGAERRIQVTRKPTNALGAFVVGMAFGAGWTPCIGPILASILLLASRTGGAGRAAALLAAYSLGLAVPFLAAGLFFDRLTPLWAWFKRRARGVRLVSGLLLVAIGAAMALGRLTAFNAMTFRLGYLAQSALAEGPEAAKAWTVALLGLAAVLTALGGVVARRRNPEARLLGRGRVIVLAILALAAVLELTGVVSWLALVSGWLLFQGA